MIKLALEHLYDATVARFAADEINAVNVFGWSQPAQNLGDRPRVAWIPGDPGSSLGELGGARNPGQEIRPLAQLNELFTVIITAWDPRDPDSERAQYRAARWLYEAWFRAIYLAAPATFRVRSQTWMREQVEGHFGATLRCVCEVQSPILDALPDEPIVGGAYAGRADGIGINVPTADVGVELQTSDSDDNDE